MFQEDDDDVIPIEDEPTCSTFNSNEHAYSYSEFLIIAYEQMRIDSIRRGNTYASRYSFENPAENSIGRGWRTGVGRIVVECEVALGGADDGGRSLGGGSRRDATHLAYLEAYVQPQ